MGAKVGRKLVCGCTPHFDREFCPPSVGDVILCSFHNLTVKVVGTVSATRSAAHTIGEVNGRGTQQITNPLLKELWIARVTQGISTNELYRKHGLKVSVWETGAATPRLPGLEAYAKALGFRLKLEEITE